ncbi:hypothetical protein Taro_008326 [Colocasia esculenta]|uniref:Uncharacterized protein n=1 Tax=Colocasia esculenta TaxID=4460 RepID=A0A843U219_COLES|nr:hypothetical protein [Colocasia esculenta]
MSSLVERLRARTERKRLYTEDDSDDDLLIPKRGKLAPAPASAPSPEKLERIVREDAVSPLNEIEKILDCELRPTGGEADDASKSTSKQKFVKQYLVKWKGMSYLHCTWVAEKDFIKAFKEFPRLKTKVNNFKRQMDLVNNSEDEWIPVRSEWTTVDRVIASRSLAITWLLKAVRSFSEGKLHPYQLEGLNFLRYSWSKNTHVILADEMGLGKTIQSIAFLASLFKENLSPHLVVAPLSTLRNWEREFATWAPHMNIVMYFGSSQSRAVIREYEFFFPKEKLKKKKKMKAAKDVKQKRGKRIKFDVLLTSYEMINMDAGYLKAINWECVIVDEGHRLKNKDSKLFSTLKLFSSKHRVLLTGTPLQVLRLVRLSPRHLPDLPKQCLIVPSTAFLSLTMCSCALVSNICLPS